MTDGRSRSLPRCAFMLDEPHTHTHTHDHSAVPLPGEMVRSDEACSSFPVDRWCVCAAVVAVPLSAGQR